MVTEGEERLGEGPPEPGVLGGRDGARLPRLHDEFGQALAHRRVGLPEDDAVLDVQVVRSASRERRPVLTRWVFAVGLTAASRICCFRILAAWRTAHPLTEQLVDESGDMRKNPGSICWL
jgi:hypothetical protein